MYCAVVVGTELFPLVQDADPIFLHTVVYIYTQVFKQILQKIKITY